MKRERFSTLTYSGSKKISRMPARAAIVGFSVENVYAIAELIRRQKGGCAVVMGALSPRTRNAQVALYQNGDVDYLVATDAIGMGLNLDIHHVAFSSTAKFDGRRMRSLNPQELAQIAGRAGRHVDNGTFGVTGEARPLDDEVVEAIESHRFAPLRKLHWRNDVLDFGTPERLIRSLEYPTSDEWLTRARDADDVLALKTLSAIPEVRDKLTSPKRVQLLWDVCRIPDFRNASGPEHTTLLERIFDFLVGRGMGGGRIPSDWLAQAIKRIDKIDGDIDTLSKRLAYIRTWTYIAQRKSWVQDESHWRDETRAVEDRLSDALHAALTQRFVDRRTSVLLRRLKQKETLVAEVNDKGEVTVSGELVGRLEGFRFRQDASSSPDEARTLRQTAEAVLKPEFHLRADRFYNAPDTEMDFTTQGGLMWGTTAVGKLVKGPEVSRPQVEVFVDEEAGPDVADKVRRRMQHFIDRKVALHFEPLLAMGRDETLVGLARGFAFRLVEGLGVLPRDAVANDVKELDQDSRGALRKHGVRFGQFTIFMQPLLKPAPTRLRLVLWSLFNGLQEFPESPPPGLVTIPNLPDVPKSHYTLAGYHPAGARAIRIDMLERLADLVRARDSKAGFEAGPDMLSITGMTLEQFAGLMGGLGYAGARAERQKAKPAPVIEPVDPDAPVLPIPEEVSLVAEAEAAAAAAAAIPPEMEVYYTFTWAPKPRAPRPERNARPPRSDASRPEGAAADRQPRPDRGARPDRGPRPDQAPRTQQPAVGADGAPVQAERAPRPQNDRPQGERRDRDKFKGGKPQGKFDRNDRGPKDAPRDAKANSYEARSPRAEKPIDPDNPFAVLAALRGKI
jgi:ATP-dependent RNA helicase SUPV3L1/SUV3